MQKTKRLPLRDSLFSFEKETSETASLPCIVIHDRFFLAQDHLLTRSKEISSDKIS